MSQSAIPPDLAKIKQHIETTTHALNTNIAYSTTAQLASWIERILVWNKKIDLTAARNLDELVDLCIADALVISQHIEKGLRVVDVGSGAGAPGLPLAILRPDLHLTLVEPIAKRVSFLRTVIGGSQITATVERKRGEELDTGCWDVALSRATLGPDAWLELGSRLVRDNGLIAVLLARKDPPSHASAIMKEEDAYAWPLTGTARRIQWYQRCAETVA
jgi:16S rRNA (guanine527-N7)-methyltransferase